MAQVSLLVASGYYLLIAIWWLTQVTKRYQFSKQRHNDFSSSVTYPCVSFQQHPVEGIFKTVTSLVIAICLFSFNGALQNDYQFLSNTEIATIFLFFMMSGVADVISKWSGKTFYQGLDYVALVLFFSMQCVVLSSRVQFSEPPKAILYSLMLYTSLATLLVTLVEMKYPDQVMYPVIRSYLLLIHSTWGLQLAFLVEDKSVVLGTDPEKSLLLAMYFSWHCGVNFFLMLSVWLVVSKMMQKHLCCCVHADRAGATDTICLENRVHFDYNILDRFESDVD